MWYSRDINYILTGYYRRLVHSFKKNTTQSYSVHLSSWVMKMIFKNKIFEEIRKNKYTEFLPDINSISLNLHISVCHEDLPY